MCKGKRAFRSHSTLHTARIQRALQRAAAVPIDRCHGLSLWHVDSGERKLAGKTMCGFHGTRPCKAHQTFVRRLLDLVELACLGSDDCDQLMRAHGRFRENTCEQGILFKIRFISPQYCDLDAPFRSVRLMSPVLASLHHTSCDANLSISTSQLRPIVNNVMRRFQDI